MVQFFFLTFFFQYSPILFLFKLIFWSGTLELVSSSGYNCHDCLLPSSNPYVELSHEDVSLSLESSAQDLHDFLWSTQVCESNSKQHWWTQNSWLGRAAAHQTGTTVPGAPPWAVASGGQQDQPLWASTARAAAAMTEAWPFQGGEDSTAWEQGGEWRWPSTCQLPGCHETALMNCLSSNTSKFPSFIKISHCFLCK